MTDRRRTRRKPLEHKSIDHMPWNISPWTIVFRSVCLRRRGKGAVKKLWYYRGNVFSLDFCILAEKSEKNDGKNGKEKLTITLFEKNI